MADNAKQPAAQAGTKSKLVQIEEQVLAEWTKNDTFKKSLNKRSPRGEFVFYDGPPFATGLPHYGHMLASFIKDAIPRYKTMRGFHVSRRWGWDCHGLPVENLIEKELGLKSRLDIQEYGIERFNAVAQESVLRYADEWRKQIPRIGRWVDMENDYRTMDAGYTESVWWVFKTLYDKGLIYEGFKSMQICPRCGTTLSNFEVNQGYKDISDLSVYVQFAFKNEKNAYFLAWTTTPWTLPGNVALAVGADIDYARVVHDGKTYVLARERVADVFAGKEYDLREVVKGSQLLGAQYKPLFPYYDNEGLRNRSNGFKVYAADFVTTEDGTGIVHIAPAFGEDDMKLGQKFDLPFIQHVGMDGRFKPEVSDFAGQPVKPKSDDKDGHQKADVEIIKWLAKEGVLFDKKKIVHSYPHCWRCDTPLLNYAATSWFVRVTEFRDKLVEANKKVSWVPSDIRDGRFGKWLEGARDWAISRSRFWGAPIPVWKGSESGKLYAVGTVAELSRLVKKSGNTYTLLRHGEAESNALGVSNADIRKENHLTDKGRKQVAARAVQLAAEGVDVIVASDFMRTKETARMVAEACGIDPNKIVYDERLREYNVGEEREWKSWKETEETVRQKGLFPGMESPAHLKARVFAALYDIDQKYSNKKILIVAHGSPLNNLMHGIWSEAGHHKIAHDERKYFRETAEMHKLADFARLPHNSMFDLDLHRPFIDKVEYVAPDGEALVRVPDVFDCWFESGSMPYGEACYTGSATSYFNPKGGFMKKSVGFPADFIAEGLDQTRGWFYSMLVLGVALFGESPYKNVVVNGIILAEDGEKMSKRLKNYPDPTDVITKYGADSLRYYVLSSPVVAAQDLKFSEKGVDEVSKKLLQRLDNVLAFYELYADTSTKADWSSKHPLDAWIRARLVETDSEVTGWLDSYQLDKAARPLMSFVDDLSTWYVRRSRDRFKSDDAADKAAALGTTKYVLNEFSRIAAPFLPFYADHLFNKTKSKGAEESVHLVDWPERRTLSRSGQVILKDMAAVRATVTLALEQRAKANIKVRQPLAKLSIKNAEFDSRLLDLIKDEVNVKEVVADSRLQEEVSLDVTVTEDLKKEGIVRDLIRAIQDLRKKEGLTVGDKVSLLLDSDEKGKELVRAFIGDIKKVTLVAGVEHASLPEKEALSIEGYVFRLGIKR